MNRAELQALSRMRIREAKSLLNAGHFSGAYYLAGYSLECALKACIAKGTQRHDFPDKAKVNESYVHDPAKLLKTANLQSLLDLAILANRELEKRWALVRSWSEQSRYKTVTQADATAIIDALGNSRHGVLRWIRQHW